MRRRPLRKFNSWLFRKEYEKNIPAVISNSAGTYVCNHLFYELLYWCDKLSLPTKIGFVHLPRLPEQVIGTQNPSMPLQQMQIALHEIIKIL